MSERVCVLKYEPINPKSWNIVTLCLASHIQLNHHGFLLQYVKECSFPHRRWGWDYFSVTLGVSWGWNPPTFNIPDCCQMTNNHLAAIHIPLSAYPTALLRWPVNHKSVKCLLDMISRPTVGKENGRRGGRLLCSSHTGNGTVWRFVWWFGCFINVLLKLS